MQTIQRLSSIDAEVFDAGLVSIFQPATLNWSLWYFTFDHISETLGVQILPILQIQNNECAQLLNG